MIHGSGGLLSTTFSHDRDAGAANRVVISAAWVPKRAISAALWTNSEVPCAEQLKGDIGPVSSCSSNREECARFLLTFKEK